ncbi:dihydrolipoamide acetyltransferase family protein [Flavobacterium sp.]|uniref:dihydrolipoamide acetyltransferase family protein n=2 Tax=Flavobacterium TaxID=237 RepID=UPI0039E4C262
MNMFEFKMPKMGESISEATIISWTKNVGDYIEAEETLLEVATDKVDSEVPSPVSGTITEIRFQKDDVVEVGTVLALIDAEGKQEPRSKSQEIITAKVESQPEVIKPSNIEFKQVKTNPDAYLSPLIISIAQKENLSLEEVQSIPGSGIDGRIQKSDVFNYLKNRKYPLQSKPITNPDSYRDKQPTTFPKPKINFVEGKDRIVEMDRMRKMIADHMVYSKQTSPHVTSYLEVDVTNLVNWRNENKDTFQEKYGEKLTFTPIFIDAVAKAIQDFPMINVSVDENKVIVHNDINIGMATALPTGNLIVSVVKNANEKDMISIAKEVNYLAESARNNKLKPEDIQGSTFTISNVGTFGSLMGTPIINQPEVAILALGIIKKRPEVVTTEKGDEIAIRSMMFLSLSFDHRVVDGFLGGSFLKRVGDYLEQFDSNTKI